MINDNRYFINEVIGLVNTYVSKINKYLREDVPHIFIDKVNVKYPSSEILTDYLGKSTCKAVITFKYHTELGSEKYKQKQESVEVPILIDGIYVIKGLCKLPLNRVINDPECAIYADKVILNDHLQIKFKDGLIFRPDGERKFIKTDIDQLSEEDLAISDYCAKKLRLLFNLSEVPTHITPEVLAAVMSSKGSDKRDHALNKRIITPEMALLRSIRIDGTVLDQIRGKFYNSMVGRRKDKTGTIYLKSLQNSINAFFNNQNEHLTGIQSPTNANPLIFESMKDMVIFENDSSKTSKVVPYSKYDLSFYGIVDPALTPDNKNSSRQNHLSRSAIIKNGDTYIKCYDPEFNEVEVKLIDYISSKVLISSCVDYDFNEIKYDEVGNVTVKYFYEEIFSKDFDYIELHPDYRLCLSGAQIPMLNLCDSARVAMGGKMINQAIGVIGGEKPRVSSGNDRCTNNPLVINFEENLGEVVDVDAGMITIKLPDGSSVTKSIPRPIKGNNNTNITFESNVEVGQKIHRGDMLIKPTSMSDDAQLKLGINARVALMTYRGYNFEDGVIVSESFAKKMTHITVEDVKIEITPDIIIEGMATVGQQINSTTPLIEGRKARRSGGSSKNFKMDLGLNKKFYSPWKYLPSNNIEQAIIYDVKVVEGTEPCLSDETEFHMSSRGVMMQFDKNFIYNGYPEIDDKFYQDLQYIKDFKATEGSCYTVKFRMIVYHPLKNGDKVTNRYGSKGVNSLIIPDDQMPYDAEGNRIEVLMNPDAPLSRKNIPQTMEVELNQLMSKVFEINKKLMEEGKIDEVRANFKKYRMPSYYKMTDEELIRVHEKDECYEYVTGCFSKITPKDVVEWKNELGVEAGITLWDGVTKKRIRRPIMVGEMYLTKLYFLAEAYAKVTSEHIPGVGNLVMNKGSVTKRGSKHGNMEMDAIIASSATDYLKFMKQADGGSAGMMIAHALLTGLIFRVADSTNNAEED